MEFKLSGFRVLRVVKSGVFRGRRTPMCLLVAKAGEVRGLKAPKCVSWGGGGTAGVWC